MPKVKIAKIIIKIKKFFSFEDLINFRITNIKSIYAIY